MRKLHLLYRITNIHTGQYYIGIHSTTEIEDGYMGSGTYLRQAIKKHGFQSFTREILETFPSRDAAFEREKELVTIETLADPLSYNLVLGGPLNANSIPEKRELFYRKAPESIKKCPIQKFNETYKYEFVLNQNVTYSPKFKNWAPSEAIANYLNSEGAKKLLVELSQLFNEKSNNSFARRKLRKLVTENKEYLGTIMIKTIPWAHSKIV